MAKITLGKRPKSFKHVVSFPIPGEKDAGSIEVTLKYRTRSEFAAFVDEMQSAAKVESDQEVERMKDTIEKGGTVADITQGEIMGRQNDYNARYVMGIVEGWNLDIPFDQEAVAQLVDEMPAAAVAIINAYRSATVEGRLGN